MRILVVHAWLKGNLGDALQLTVLLTALRELRPRVLDLAGFPASPPEALASVLALSDRFIADPVRLGTGSPRRARRQCVARAALARTPESPVLRVRRDHLRAWSVPRRLRPARPSALADIAAAAELGRLVILSSHSIGPLSPEALQVVARASIRIAREPWTHAYLGARRIDSVSSADLAFLYPYERELGPPPLEPPYRVLFLRSNNLRKQRAADRARRRVRGRTRDRAVLTASHRAGDERSAP